jgi:hypothetical protein
MMKLKMQNTSQNIENPNTYGTLVSKAFSA